MNDHYLFTSKRLGFRTWSSEDLSQLAEMCADPEVMEHFPSPLTLKESERLLERLRGHFNKNGYTYFAVEVLATGEWIGFVGLAYQEYVTDFTPATDIGWRLKKDAWGKGYATEGAKRCLEFGFSDIRLDKIVSVCTLYNSKSESVMQKIGMIKKGEFDHPSLTEYPEHERCILYEAHNFM
ncbi:MAG: GNAT family N-acetyltransferase [Crocinitomicaceae bacterium]